MPCWRQSDQGVDKLTLPIKCRFDGRADLKKDALKFLLRSNLFEKNSP